MSRIPTTILLSLGIAVLLLACDAPRKACRKAERLTARAVWKCPDILKLDTVRDTVVITLPGDTITGEAIYAEADIMMILRQCDSLARAYADTVRHREDPAPRSEAIHNAVTTLRREACRIPPMHLDTAGLIIDIRVVDNGLEVDIIRMPQRVPVPVAIPCPPRAQPGTGTYTGVAAWYASGFWLLLVLCIVLAASHFIKRT